MDVFYGSGGGVGGNALVISAPALYGTGGSLGGGEAAIGND